MLDFFGFLTGVYRKPTFSILTFKIVPVNKKTFDSDRFLYYRYVLAQVLEIRRFLKVAFKLCSPDHEAYAEIYLPNLRT